MHKILSLVLALMLIISCIPALAEEAAAVKTGLSFTIDLTSSKDGQAQANISITAVTVDENGVITQCIIDVIQGKVKFDENGMLSSETPISFEYLTNESSNHIAVAEAVQADLSAIGIDMTVQVTEWNVFLDERKSGNYDVARNGWLCDFNDPINMLEMWLTDSGNNDCQFGR